jgi:hypothetical protein
MLYIKSRMRNEILLLDVELYSRLIDDDIINVY